MTIHEEHCEPWNVTLIDTGLHTMTGGRVKRAQKYVGDEPFMLTYGDGVSDIDIGKLVLTSYNSQLFTVLGNGNTSLMLDIPVRYMTQRSKPSPNPACLVEPYFLRSK